MALLDTVQERLGRVSIRTKILGIVLALTMLLGLGVTWQVRGVMAGVLGQEVRSRGAAVISDIAGRSVEHILLENTVALHNLLETTIANHPDTLYAFVVDEDGGVLAHTFGQVGFPVELLSLASEGVGEISFETEYGVVHDFTQPILDGSLGTAHLGLTEARLQGVINSTTGQMLLTTLAVSVLGIGAAVLLTWLLTRPILDLVAVTRRVSSGDMSARATTWAADEVGTLADAFNTMVAELESSHASLRENEAARTRLLHQTIDAQEEERRRISRELHDSIGQALNSIALEARSLGNSCEPGRSRAGQVEQVAKEALQTVRQLSRELRPAALDDLGLAAALENYVGSFRESHPGVEVDHHIDLPDRLDRAVETALYRMVQEAITNAGRHSGAETLSIVMSRRENQVTAIVEDDGSGFDLETVERFGESVGIHGMRERAELIGGTMRIESSALGTTVYIEAPA
jgi:signal transduction histidine kinase